MGRRQLVRELAQAIRDVEFAYSRSKSGSDMRIDPRGFATTDMVGTAVLLEAARQAKLNRYLQVSTDEVYGSLEKGSSKEDDVLDPRSPYSASKAGTDLLTRSYWSTYRFPVVITRGSNTYGPNQYPEKFITLFATNAL